MNSKRPARHLPVVLALVAYPLVFSLWFLTDPWFRENLYRSGSSFNQGDNGLAFLHDYLDEQRCPGTESSCIKHWTYPLEYRQPPIQSVLLRILPARNPFHYYEDQSADIERARIAAREESRQKSDCIEIPLDAGIATEPFSEGEPPDEALPDTEPSQEPDPRPPCTPEVPPQYPAMPPSDVVAGYRPEGLLLPNEYQWVEQGGWIILSPGFWDYGPLSTFIDEIDPVQFDDQLEQASASPLPPETSGDEPEYCSEDSSADSSTILAVHPSWASFAGKSAPCSVGLAGSALRHAIPLLSTEYGTLLASWNIGKGRVYLLACPELLYNKNLSDGLSLELVTGLLPVGRTIFFDEWVHDLSEGDSVVEFLASHGFGMSIALISLSGFLWAWRGFVATGPRHEDPAPGRPDALDLINDLGALYGRNLTREETLALYREAFVRELSIRHSIRGKPLDQMVCDYLHEPQTPTTRGLSLNTLNAAYRRLYREKRTRNRR